MADPQGEGSGGIGLALRSDIAPRSASWTSLAGGLGAILLPKCPLCFAAYGSSLGAIGFTPGVQQRLVEPLVAVAVMASFGLVSVASARRRDVVPPVVSAVGAGLLLAGRLVFSEPAITAVGAVLLVAAALANSVRCRRTHAATRE